MTLQEPSPWRAQCPLVHTIEVPTCSNLLIYMQAHLLALAVLAAVSVSLSSGDFPYQSVHGIQVEQVSPAWAKG